MLFCYPQRKTNLTREVEEATLNCASNGLQFDHIHRLANVHGAGHAPKGAPDILSHLLNGEHLQQLIKDIREAVQQRRLKGETKETEKQFLVYTYIKYPVLTSY